MSFLTITAIAWLTVRDAVRSRLLVSLTAILLVGLIGLPLLISGDNTLRGQVQVILGYTLSFAMSMLSAVTLWVACGGIASEIQDRRLYLVLTKPVHRHELWLGKWLGIVGINAMLLSLTGLILTTMIWHTLRVSPESAETKREIGEQFLLARQPLPPSLPDWSGLAKLESEKLVSSGKAPAGMDRRAIESELMKEYERRQWTVLPNGAISLDYHLPAPATGVHDLILTYSFESSRPERTPVAAAWRIDTVPVRSLVLEVTNYPGMPNSILIPGSLVRGSQSIRLTYHRLDAQNPATLLMAAGGTQPELLVPTGNGTPNLTRGLLIILFRLAFLAALGLTAGCLLSAPVAVFVAFFVMILLAISGYVESVATSGVFYVAHEGPAPTQTWLDVAILHLFKGFNGVTQPFIRFDPVPLLQEGRRVGWDLTVHAAVWLVGLYTTLTAVIGIALFNRREIG